MGHCVQKPGFFAMLGVIGDGKMAGMAGQVSDQAHSGLLLMRRVEKTATM